MVHGVSKPRSGGVLPDVPAHAAPPRPDVLLRHALPAARRPARRPCPLRLRARRGRDRRRARRPPAGPPRRAALDAWQAELERGLAAGRSRPPGHRRARRRRRRATACRCTCSRATWTRCASTATSPCGSPRAPSSTTTWRAARRPSGASWPRCSARREPEEVARLGVAFQLTNFIRDVRDRLGRWTASTCPGCPRTTCAPAPPASRLRERVAQEVARARGLFAETAGVAPGAGARRCAAACAWRARSTRACSTASSATATTCSARGRACARGRRGARGALGAMTRRRRGAPTSSSAARRSPASPSRASWPAPAPTCSSSTATRSARARPRPARRRRRGCTPWASRAPIRRELPAMTFTTPHGTRALPAAVELVGLRLPRAVRGCCGRSAATRASRRAKVERARGRRRVGAPTAATCEAPLVVDAMGWRRVLDRPAPPAARRAAEPRPRGPSRTPRATATPSTSGSSARSCAAATAGACPPAARRASAWAPTTRASTSARRPTRSPPASTRRPCATRATGSRTACARPTDGEVLYVGDSAGHCFPLSGEGIRTAFYFGIAAGRELRRRARRREDRASARWPTTPPSTTPTRAPSARALRLQRLVPALPPRVLTARCCGRSAPQPLVDRAFGWYLEQAHPRLAEQS